MKSFLAGCALVLFSTGLFACGPAAEEPTTAGEKPLVAGEPAILPNPEAADAEPEAGQALSTLDLSQPGGAL